MTNDHNRDAWNAIAARGESPYACAVTPEMVAAARRGEWAVLLTDTKPLPRAWLPAVSGLDILCLASGGGQQGPLLAAGANVTVLDLSEGQLALDREVAGREGLGLRLVRGSMTDLSAFGDASFDVIVHPVSNLFIPDVRPVWREAYRVLRPGGSLLSGFLNPAMFIFDLDHLDETGELRVRHTLPYAEGAHLSPERLEAYRREGRPLHFSHTLTEQIAGQIDAGFLIAGLYEDDHGVYDPLSSHMPTQLATRAIKWETSVRSSLISYRITK